MIEQRTLGTLRTEHGLTQEALAAQSSVSRLTIAKLEGGDHNPNLDTLHKLAKVLGDDVYKLAYGWRRKPRGTRGRPKMRTHEGEQHEADYEARP